MVKTDIGFINYNFVITDKSILSSIFWMRSEERNCLRYLTWLLEFSVMQNAICLLSQAQLSTRAETKDCLSTEEQYK